MYTPDFDNLYELGLFVLCTFISLMFLPFAINNLTHDYREDSGLRLFGYEMDEVMGLMLMFPKYSKFEFLMLILGSIGSLWIWIDGPSIISSGGPLLLANYMSICCVYFYLTK